MKRLSLVVSLLLLLGCNSSHEEKFDRNKWFYKDDMDFPYRNGMLSDLVKNHKLKGLTYHQLSDFLGTPWYDNNERYYYYPALVDYGSDIDPVHTRSLIIIINKDSIVTQAKIEEWKKSD